MRWLLFVPLLMTACGFRPSEPPKSPVVVVGKATLSGRVVDLSEIPVPNMRVTCSESDATVVTDADGKWSLEVPADTAITIRAVPVNPLNVYKDVTVGPMQLSNRMNVGVRCSRRIIHA